MIISIISQKGGVSKTSLVQNVAAELAAHRYSTLVGDYAPQSNLTQGWGLIQMPAALLFLIPHNWYFGNPLHGLLGAKVAPEE